LDILYNYKYLESQGYWHQRADERHGNPSQGNQELLVVRDKVGRPPGELGISKSMECDVFPFSALTLLVGRQERHPASKKTGCWFVGGDMIGALHDL